jgi:hypothetical protein
MMLAGNKTKMNPKKKNKIKKEEVEQQGIGT